MKRITYSCFYKVLSFLSNYFDNRYLKKYKVLLGTTLLVLTGACQTHKKDKPEDKLCYAPLPVVEDTLEVRIADSSTLSSYQASADIQDMELQEIESDVTCYEPAPDFYMNVEQMPKFPGGDKELINYLQEKMIYPKKALKDSIQGRVVVSFIVEKDGSLGSIEVVCGITASLDKEAIRIIRSMPAWIPGKQRDKIVRVKYTLPVRFKLPETSTEK